MTPSCTRWPLICVFILLTGCASTPTTRINPWSTFECTGQSVLLSEYVRYLPNANLTVGFDVDDTALFSTPAFLFAKANLLPEPEPHCGGGAICWRSRHDLMAAREELYSKLVQSNGEGLSRYERDQWRNFWDDVNNVGSDLSPPKTAALRLVKDHLARGDTVVFVTARVATPRERLSDALRRIFGGSVDVRFTSHGEKASEIRRRKISIFYGDADGDMRDARAGGARGVRFLRSEYSSNRSGISGIGSSGECYLLTDSEL